MATGLEEGGAATRAIFLILGYQMAQVPAGRPKSQVLNRDRIQLSPVSQCSHIRGTEEGPVERIAVAQKGTVRINL